MLNKKGFTLIELLVSMSIMAVMTTLAFVNFRSAEYGDELRFAAQNLAAEIRRAQTFALISKPLNYCRESATINGNFCPSTDDLDCGSGGQCVLNSPRGGYGLRVGTLGSGGSSVFFADTGDAERTGNVDHRYQDYESLRRLDFIVGQNVSVTAVEPSDDGVLDIVFVAPRPIAWFNDSRDDLIAVITLTHSRTNNSKTVRVNSISGQISVD